MAVAQRMDETTYFEFVLSEPDGAWELHDGALVEKPGLSWDHGSMVRRLMVMLDHLLADTEFQVFTELRVRRPEATVFLPDLMVVPTAYGEGFAGRPVLAVFPQPLPLVVEVWSPSTGDYDVDTKIPVYQKRGDAEICRIHPYERTLTRWVRQTDGMYAEEVLYGGMVRLAALPGVTIDQDRIFAL